MARRLKKLKVMYSKRQREFLYDFPEGRRPDGALLHMVLSTPMYNNLEEQMPSVEEELKNRVYDLSTLYFEIRLKE